MRWQVYKYFFNFQPVSKHKYVIIAYRDGDNALGLLINSKMNQYIQKTQTRIDCQALIKASEHTFLNYDSYVDCKEAHKLSYQDLQTNGQHLGSVSPQGQQDILVAVQRCTLLSPNEQNLILTS